MSAIPYLGDTFTRSNAAVPGSTEIGKAPYLIQNASGTGVWNITSNKLVATSNGSESYCTAESYHSDGTVQATMVNIVDGGLIFRYSGAADFWMIWATGGVYKIMKKTAGTYAQVGANTSVSPVAGDVVKVDLDLNSIILSINGVQRLSVSDSWLNWGTRIGFRASASAASYDSLSWQSLSKGGIGPDDSDLIYSPYTWVVGSTQAKTICSGAYFRTIFSGNRGQVGLFFDTSGVDTQNWIKYRIDGEAWVKALVTEQVLVPMPSGSTWAKHTLEVLVQSAMGTNKWTPQGSATVFTGIAGEDTIVTHAGNKAALNILVFGDSIAEGYVTLKNVGTPDGSDAQLSFAGQLRYFIGAEVGQVGFGSTGWSVSGAGGVPAFPTHYKVMWSSGPNRDFTTTPPDVVVINHGENDGVTNTIATIQAMVTELLTLVPATTLVALVCPFSQKQKTNIQTAVANLANARVKFIDTSSWTTVTDLVDGIHPYGGVSKDVLAPKLAEAVRVVLNGGGMYLNVAGTATAVANVRR